MIISAKVFKIYLTIIRIIKPTFEINRTILTCLDHRSELCVTYGQNEPKCRKASLLRIDFFELIIF